MDKLIELLGQIQDLAGVAIDALKGAEGKGGGGERPPMHEGGGGKPPAAEGGKPEPDGDEGRPPMGR